MFACAPSTNWVVGAAEGVVAIMLAVGTLGEVVEMKTAFQPKGGRKGRQAGSLCDVLCLGASNGDDDGRGRFPFAAFVGGGPSGFLREDEARVESGEFFSDVEESVGGRDAVDYQLCRGHVQVDRGGARNKVEEGRGSGIESSCLDRFHGNESNVVEGVTLNVLDKGRAEGRVNLVPEGDGGRWKGCPITFDVEPSFPEGGGLPSLRGRGFGCGLGWGRGCLCARWGGGLLLLRPLCNCGSSRGRNGWSGL